MKGSRPLLPVRRAEALAVVLVGGVLVVAVFLAAARTLQTPTASGARAWPTGPREDPHGRAFSSGAALRADVDPLRPPGLPAGIDIDPATGRMTGLDLQAQPGERALDWGVLAVADAATSAASLDAGTRALDGERVVLAGFLMPLYEIEDIREFLLVGSHYACCFGRPPGLGGLVHVRLAKGEAGLAPLLEPLRVSGRMHVRERRLGPEPTDELILLFELDDAEARRLR